MKKCPCEDCLCIAICKHKEYAYLVHDCITVWKYITNIPLTTFEDDPYKINPYLVRVFNTLRPDKWIIRDYHGTNKDLSIVKLSINKG
jgi:hypothetical protein